MPRDDFSPTIKNAVALRAGYLCSICKRLTVGPSDESNTSASKTGEAAHIYGAARGDQSRRQDPSISSEFRSSIGNAIWLCDNHSKLIDRDEITFSPKVLLEYKANHETYIKLLNSGVNTKNGLITKLEISNLPFLGSYVRMELSERSVIVGDNGTGKTMICELIRSLSDRALLDRWMRRINKSNVFFHVHYFKEQEEKYSMVIDQNNNISYRLNDIVVPILGSPLQVFYIKEDLDEYSSQFEKRREMTIVELMAGYFSLTQSELENTITSMQAQRKYFLTDIYIDEKRELIVTYGKRIGSFNSFSGGERQRIMLDIIICIANYYAKFRSTILLLERNAIATIDDSGIERFLDLLRYENLPFQLILTVFFRTKFRFNFENFRVYKLDNSNNKIVASLY